MTAPDLSRLTEAERAVLALLAEGHTAKSIAAETGRSEAAVNERLREARRKTGVGSSRELARLLRAQENRDEQIGVPPPPEAGAAPDGAQRVRPLKGLFLMITIAASLAAGLTLFLSNGQATPDDPRVAAVAGQWGLSPDAVRAIMARETRDDGWAAATEALLQRRYRAVAGIDPASLRIICRATWCEVVGQSAGGAPEATLRAAARELGSAALRDSLTAEHLHADVTGSKSDTDHGRFHFSFLAYWHRRPD